MNIGCDVFEGCCSIIYNEYKGGNYLGNDQNPYLIFMQVMDDSLCQINKATKIIYSNAFKNSFIENIIIPNSVFFIGTSAFEGCSLKSITIPDSVISIKMLLRIVII